MMTWLPTLVFYMGVTDAAVIMLLGIITAIVILLGWDASKLWERLGPALACLIGSNVAAALVLLATRYFIGG